LLVVAVIATEEKEKKKGIGEGEEKKRKARGSKSGSTYPGWPTGGERKRSFWKEDEELTHSQPYTRGRKGRERASGRLLLSTTTYLRFHRRGEGGGNREKEQGKK